jgi:uncharacterized YigZ family protein
MELREKASRFLGQVFRVGDECAAADALAAVRRTHHAATHHCWARRLGVPEAVQERFDDDGEPSGTAGAPLLTVLAGANIYGVLLVVTRYYGGTKLGRGGLARAYAEAARQAVAAAPRREVFRETRLAIECPFGDVGAVEAVLAREAARVRGTEREFAEDGARFCVTVLRGDASPLESALTQATAGRARVVRPECAD